MLIVCLFSAIICKPFDVSVRKGLYYIFLILAVLSAVVFLILVIYAFASDWETDWCLNNYNEYNDYYDNG